MTEESLRARRERVVLAHIDAESRHDFEAALSTFSRPRYEVVPNADVFEGPDAVRAFYDETARAFPDFRFEEMTLYHSDEAVIVEVDFVGTHRGPWRGLPPTGRTIRYRMCNVFVFEGDRLLCERLHFDLLTILQQLGIARDPTSLAGQVETFVTHPLTVGLAFLRQLVGR